MNYDEEQFRASAVEKFETLVNSHERIQTLGLWAIHHRSNSSMLVNVWNSHLRVCHPDRHIPMIMFANEVIQGSRSKGPEFVLSFQPAIGPALKVVSGFDVERNPKLKRVLDIWKERAVYAPEVVQEWLQIIDDCQLQHEMKSQPKTSAIDESPMPPPPPETPADTSVITFSTVSACSSRSVPQAAEKEAPPPPSTTTPSVSTFKPPTGPSSAALSAQVAASLRQSIAADLGDGGDMLSAKAIRSHLANMFGAEESTTNDVQTRSVLAGLPNSICDKALASSLSDQKAEELLNVSQDATSVATTYIERFQKEKEKHDEFIDKLKDLKNFHSAQLTNDQLALKSLVNQLNDAKKTVAQLQSHTDSLPDMSMFPSNTKSHRDNFAV